MKIIPALIAVIALPLAFAADNKISAGTGTLYFGGRPNHVYLVDEATEKVTGDIHLKTGSCGRLSLSLDKKRFYAENIAY
ncbi:MAG TPA: hypothetical protein VGV35_09265, partial [Bryobacteraceae bacterium]|nr:hypothetical protein [Bryobacteraceae bacterium]